MSHTQKEQVIQKFFNNTLFVLGFLLVCRLIASYLIPLNDATEARYGEIARKMLETGNWVTLQHEYGVPFWAKPPLSTWLSVISMKLFGVNEFALRLPGLLLSIGILWLIWDLAKKHSGVAAARVATLVLAGTFYFFLDAGVVMTEPALIFCTTLATVAFWHALINKHKIWSYVFFIALGLGLLAKGPVAIVLVGLPVFFWVLIRNEWVNLWKRLPWIKGTLVLLAIALPWYVLAEIRTPGFLNYFIIGEHFNRFLVPGWAGDKYGSAHNASKGMIWIYAIAGTAPWSIVGSAWLVRHIKEIPALYKDNDGWMSYLFLAMSSPLLFFTFSSNVIYPYVFPALPAFALFFSEMWSRSNQSLEKSKWLLQLSMACGIGFLMATLLFEVRPDMVAKTQRSIVIEWFNQHPSPEKKLIYWGAYGAPFSAQFYSLGKVKSARNINELCHLLSNHSDNYVVINSEEKEKIPADILSSFTPVKTVKYKENKIILLHTPILTC